MKRTLFAALAACLTVACGKEAGPVAGDLDISATAAPTAARAVLLRVVGPVDAAAAASPSVVKVVLDEQGRALYFSRSLVPHSRDGGKAAYWQHLGVYAFKPDALQRVVRLPVTALEEAEKLEQLRALGHGMKIGVALLGELGRGGGALPAIDTMDDLERAEAWLATQGEPFTA